MSRLTDLIAQAKAKDPNLGKELEREFKTLASRRSFGLNFERHRPENVELPGRPIRKGDKVRILPERGSTKKGDQRLWKVRQISGKSIKRTALVELINTNEPEQQEVLTEDLIVVAEFQDYIYPGLVGTGKVEHGDNKPYHTVINGENFHALEALTFTHRGKIDAIYIDPPYNTGARDWKYNNDYVESEDQYRHSKWLAFMERRLKVAKELLNPVSSALIVTIDEKEVHRLGLLLQQVFPEVPTQMVSIVINPVGQERQKELARVEEYAFFLFFGDAGPCPVLDDGLNPPKAEQNTARSKKVRWEWLLRGGADASRLRNPELFYPIFIDPKKREIVNIGDPLPKNQQREKVLCPKGQTICWPIRTDGTEGRWRCSPQYFRELLEQGYAKLGDYNKARDQWAFLYLGKAQIRRIETGQIKTIGKADDGSVILKNVSIEQARISPKTIWNRLSHRAGEYGTGINRKLLPGRTFPYPKSLYAVEDALRIVLSSKKTGVVLDFFSGSGTTAHAVMRLNKQDGGQRQCISITNNEVAAEEQNNLRKKKLRPGDDDWEEWGICDYITKPRIKAAITGKTPEGKKIKGDYKFTDEFPMAEGFKENAEFFTLTYETPVAVSHNRAFSRIAPLLWMRAGSLGKRIDDIPQNGWEVADTYGLIIDLDKAAEFCKDIENRDDVRIAYIVTDDDRRFQSVARRLPDSVEPVRLYESYLTNFRFSMGR